LKNKCFNVVGKIFVNREHAGRTKIAKNKIKTIARSSYVKIQHYVIATAVATIGRVMM
jgi:hypothetical protein